MSQLRQVGGSSISGMLAGSIAAVSCMDVVGMSLVRLRSGHSSKASIDALLRAASFASQSHRTFWLLGMWTK